MSNNLDEFPLDDPIVDIQTGKLMPSWRNIFASFQQNLSDYLSQNGINPPQVTTSQINAQKSPPNGRTVYNTTIGSNQYFKNGTWTSY